MNEKFPSSRPKSPEELQAQASAYISNLEKSKLESKFTAALDQLSSGQASLCPQWLEKHVFETPVR